MKHKTSLTKYAVSVAWLAVLAGVGTISAQQPSKTDLSLAAPTDLTVATMAVEQVPEPDSALSSTEQGHTQLDQSFGDWNRWRLEKRRAALEDTQFIINFRTFYFDRSDFTGAEKQAWAIGGWMGFKTGYFLDHIAFGATLFTTNPIYAPDDRDGTSLLEEGQNGFTVLGEWYVDIRIFEGLNITIGAKGYDTPFISRNDNRMLPNTFEAVVVQGRTELGSSRSSSDAPVTPDG